MGKLERITKTVEVGQLNWYSRDDVLYLLSIIGQAEKALEAIYNVEALCERDSLLHALSEVNQIADQALKAIREE